MKKIISAMAVLAFLAGCTALNRVNPTDPKSGNYEGLHYTGSIGNFTTLSDISAQDPDIIWCTDSTTNMVYKYHENGNLDFTLFNRTAPYPTPTPVPLIQAPSGICADSTYFYLVDKNVTYHNLKRFDPTNVTSTTVPQPPLFATLALNKCAISGTSMYLTDSNTVYVFDTGANAMTGATWQILWPNVNISDIKVDRTTGNVVIADSGNNDIIVYSSSGIFISDFQYSFNIIGFAISGNYIYIPSNGGLHKINYPSLTEAQLLANYGQGNGKVDAPGPCDALSDGSILIGNSNSVKIFVP
jgi:hypothetical protein